ncbi:hypothetical protein HDU90_009177, partial [Geranomyces variabilis]
MNSARGVRDGEALCGCEIVNGVPQFTTVRSKEHFVAWTSANVATAKFVSKEVLTLAYIAAAAIRHIPLCAGRRRVAIHITATTYDSAHEL